MLMAIIEQTTALAAPRVRRRRFLRRPAGSPNEWLTALLFLSPALVILTLFHIWPLVYAFVLSMRRYRRGVYLDFIWFENYKEALTNGDLWRSFVNTVYFAVGTVPIEMVLAITIAYLLFQKVKFLSLFRTVYFLPYITSTVAAAAVWLWMFDSRSGVFNSILGKFGIGPYRWIQEPRGIFELLMGHLNIPWPGWADGPSLALVSIMLMTIWHYLGFQIVIFLVGLGGVPKELYEAARVDGASERSIFFRITLPQLTPTILFVAVVATIGSFQSFNQIYQMTARTGVGGPGGPLGTTETMVIQVLNEFYATRYGYGAAIAIVLFLVILALTAIQLKLSSRWVQN
jgi:multiple sugar transport system permease protein